MATERSSAVWRSLAKDGLHRADVREACTGPLLDFEYASWREWFTLEAVAEECAALAAPTEETQP